MPQFIEKAKVSWAEEVEKVEALPAPTVIIEQDLKMVVEYRIRPDGKKEKIVRTYKIERRPVSKGVAQRKSWAKFGAAALDKPGPDPGSTIIAEDVQMQFIAPKDDKEEKLEEEPAEKHKGLPDKVVKCRHCNGNHWTLKCPYKELLVKPDSKATSVKENAPRAVQEKYVPPSLREGKRERDTKRREDTIAIRVANLSESTEEPDLADLVRPFGVHTKLFLPKDKATGLCKGFAYVHFSSKDEAARVIKGLNGHGYDHLILSVDWARPQTPKS